jgi:hypothetical protein
MYRGKSKKTGEWVYGYFIEYRDESFILLEKVKSFLGGFIEVESASVGQWTGRYDKNGEKIYTNSKLRISSDIVGFINTEVGNCDFVESEPYKDYEPYTVCFHCLMDESPNEVEVVTDTQELLKAD